MQWWIKKSLPKLLHTQLTSYFLVFVTMPPSSVYQTRTFLLFTLPSLTPRWYLMVNMETYRRTSIHSTHIFTNSNNNKNICKWNKTSYKITESCTCLECYRLECFIITENHYHKFICEDCGSIYWTAVAEVEKRNVEDKAHKCKFGKKKQNLATKIKWFSHQN
jgi:hypothetical protein